MKKILALLLVMLMALSLSACSKKADDKKVLRVAMECAYAPYNWPQPDDSNGAVKIAGSTDYAYGYDVMMAKKIAEKLGYELEIVKLDWESLIPALQSGDVDAVIAGQSITAERLEQVDFSTPYYYASIVTLVKKDNLCPPPVYPGFPAANAPLSWALFGMTFACPRLRMPKYSCTGNSTGHAGCTERRNS